MNQNELSFHTQNYIQCFYDILDKMAQGMENAEILCSLSSTFINQMIPHHLGAIKMSRNLLQYTTYAPLQKIACRIIREQTKSIQNMECIFTSCLAWTNSSCEINRYLNTFQDIAQTMFYRMSNAPITNDININFINEMIPHHEAAIQMSKNLLQYSICPELVPILNAIISSQEQGVKEMKEILHDLTNTCIKNNDIL